MARKPMTAPRKLREDFKKEVEASKNKPRGGAAVGNRFWEARSTHGRDKIFNSPDILWDACKQYFKWVEDHPLTEGKAFSHQGEVTIEDLPKLRAMTIGSLCLFLDIAKSTWADYRKNDDFAGVCLNAEQVIYEQKFGGAAAGLLNHAIIARDLGLVDKREVTGADGEALQVVTRIETVYID